MLTLSIQRVPPVPFTQIANSALRDKRLSFKARGLLALVLSNVGEWNATLNWLVAQSDHDGRAAVQAALNELTELGYRVVSKESRGHGDIQTVVTWHHVPNDAVSRPMSFPTVDSSDGRKTGGSIEDHSSEQHLTEQQVDKDSPPFDEFWKAYPRKKDKGHARKAWDKAVKTTDPAVIVAAAVQFRQWCEQDSTEPEFIPYPATWINGERWTDERDPAKPTRMDAHIAHIQELWETNSVETPQKELEG